MMEDKKIEEGKKDEGKLEISQTLEVLKPIKQKGFSISFKKWGRIKNQAQKIMPPKNYWQIAGSVLLGIFATAGIGYLTSFESRNICFVLCIISLIAGVFCFIIDTKDKKISTFSKDQLMQEIEEVDEMCRESLDYIAEQDDQQKNQKSQK